MPEHRLTSARLMVQSYGDPFTPDNRNAAQVLASHLPNFAHIEDVLSNRQRDWRSDPAVPNAVEALKAAMDDLAANLTGGQNTYALQGGMGNYAYKPIYKGGIQVAHDTLAWLYVDGVPLTWRNLTGSDYTLVAYIYLAAEPV